MCRGGLRDWWEKIPELVERDTYWEGQNYFQKSNWNMLICNTHKLEILASDACYLHRLHTSELPVKNPALCQKQPFTFTLQNRCSWKCHKIHKEIPVLESLFLWRPATLLLEKRLQQRCFLVNFSKFLSNLFYRTPSCDSFYLI